MCAGTFGGGVMGLPTATASDQVTVASGDQHVCSLSVNGSITCFGSCLTSGALRDLFSGWNQYAVSSVDCVPPSSIMLPTSSSSPLPLMGSPTPPPTPTIKAVALAAGGRTTCVIAADNGGRVVCWSANRMVVPMIAERSQVSVSVGSRDAVCSLSASGGVSCWGSLGGYLGGAASFVPAGPVAAPIPTDATTGQLAVATGGRHACSLSQSGRVTCWGCPTPTFGPTPTFDGATSPTPLPDVGQCNVPTAAQTGQVAVFAGELSSCSLSAAGRLTCWGQSAATAGFQFASLPREVAAPPGLARPCVVYASFHDTSGFSAAVDASGVVTGQQQCRVTPYPSFDLIGAWSVSQAAPSESACSRMCCTDALCQGYSFGARLAAATAAGQPCALVYNITQLVPSSLMNAGLLRFGGAGAN